jgi:AraC family transcriptional activator of pobA
VSPGQVHQPLGAVHPQGWGVSFELSLLEADWQLLLDRGLARPPQLPTPEPFYTRAEALLQLLADCQAGVADAYTGRTLHALFTALLSFVAGQLAPDPTRPRPPETRGQLLARAFENLLHQHYVQWKQPAQYAAALAITGTHLNDTVKEQTRLSVSAHIQQRAVLEAKRLLYTTARNVQEIGYALGYEEPGYFGKLFKKVTGLTPQQFRRQFRE